MLSNYGKSESLKTYQAGVKRWKDSKPKLKASGRRVSDADRKRHKEALKKWKDRKPPSYAEFMRLNQPAQGASPKSNAFRQTQKKNPMLRSVDTKTFKGKSKRKALDPRRFDSRSVGFKRRKI